MITKISTKMKSKPIDKINYSQRRMNLAYDSWFESIASDAYRKHGSSRYRSRNDYLAECCFLFTMTFSTAKIHRVKNELGLLNNDFSIEFDDLQLIYSTVATQLLGDCSSKSQFGSRLPIVLACVDFEGSKWTRELPQNAKNVHLHGIWFVHPDHVSAFKRFVAGPWMRLHVLNSIHADQLEWEPYLRSKGTIAEVGAYASKVLIKSASNPLSGELVRIYPNTNGSGVSYRQSRSYVRKDKMLDKMRRAAWKEIAALRRLKEHEAIVSELPADGDEIEVSEDKGPEVGSYEWQETASVDEFCEWLGST
jgi:hypothetical protein